MTGGVSDGSRVVSTPRGARVAQMVLNMSIADAITHHVLMIDDALRSLDQSAGIYCENAHPDLAHRAAPFTTFDGSGADAVLFHFSIGSRIATTFASARCRKAIVYHNVTPPEFFDGVNGRVAAALRAGRDELRELVGRVDLALGVSEFNRAELSALGFEDTGVLPIAVPSDLVDVAPDPSWVARGAGAGPVLLHVGRIAPNKRFDDLIRILAHVQTREPRAELWLVGTDRDTETYSMALVDMAQDLGVPGVLMLGQIPASALAACYRTAAVYVCASAHEGFCVPLVEAMHFGLPVVAFDAGGIAETLGGAGVLLGERRCDLAAAVVTLLHRDREVRAAVVARELERVGSFSTAAFRECLGGHLRALLGDGGVG
ncbi:MAG: glycosyltransferase family 4 protein [Deltaproteobacteria bacterium]|nr:glycosyltransferase family 4 protein [Deltaproteobacteria bacterium]